MLKNRVQEWTAQWREEGVKLGQKAILTRQLTLKFGELPLEVQQRIDSADQEQIELWSEKVLTADSLEEMFS